MFFSPLEPSEVGVTLTTVVLFLFFCCVDNHLRTHLRLTGSVLKWPNDQILAEAFVRQKFFFFSLFGSRATCLLHSFVVALHSGVPHCDWAGGIRFPFVGKMEKGDVFFFLLLSLVAYFFSSKYAGRQTRREKTNKP